MMFASALRMVVSRLGQGLVVIFGALTISFLLTSTAGNAIDARFTGIDAETRARLIHEYGYDQPVLERYLHFLRGVIQGDFGPSIGAVSSPVTRVAEALPYTLTLVVASIVVAASVAAACAVYGTIHRSSRLDRLTRRTFMAVQGIPEFFLGLVLVLVFAVELGWLPSFGVSGPLSYVLPVAALALPLMSTLTRLLRAQLLDVLGMDFVTTLRSKGLSERTIVIRHGLRNAAPPLISYLALQIGWLLGGTIIVEVVFGIPGIGLLVVSAANVRDVGTIQAVVVAVAVGYVICNLVADLVVYAIDPRVRAA